MIVVELQKYVLCHEITKQIILTMKKVELIIHLDIIVWLKGKIIIKLKSVAN